MLYTYTSTPQTVDVNAKVMFDTNGVKNCQIEHVEGTPTIIIPNKGVYVVHIVADAGTATPSDIQLQLFNNDVAVKGAVATTSIALANETTNLSIDAFVVVRPSCPALSNTAHLTVQNIGEQAITISNVVMTVNKV